MRLRSFWLVIALPFFDGTILGLLHNKQRVTQKRPQWLLFLRVYPFGFWIHPSYGACLCLEPGPISTVCSCISAARGIKMVCFHFQRRHWVLFALFRASFKMNGRLAAAATSFRQLIFGYRTKECNERAPASLLSLAWRKLKMYEAWTWSTTQSTLFVCL